MSGFTGISKLLRFFAETRNYSVVDRIANALSPEAVEVALYDAIRTLRSIASSGRLDEDTKSALARMKVECIEELLPSEDEVGRFLRSVKENLEVARIVAIQALSSS